MYTTSVGGPQRFLSRSISRHPYDCWTVANKITTCMIFAALHEANTLPIGQLTMRCSLPDIMHLHQPQMRFQLRMIHCPGPTLSCTQSINQITQDVRSCRSSWLLSAEEPLNSIERQGHPLWREQDPQKYEHLRAGPLRVFPKTRTLVAGDCTLRTSTLRHERRAPKE